MKRKFVFSWYREDATHCSYCGRELEEIDVGIHYESQGGTPVQLFTRRCTRKLFGFIPLNCGAIHCGGLSC